jgi:hypothetical protein
MGAPTSRPKDKPETFKLRRVVDDGTGRSILVGESDVSADEYPVAYVALLLQPPGILAGRKPTSDCEGQIWGTWNEEEMAQFRAPHEGVLMGPITPNIFARLLAKIAHGYAVAVLGSRNFKPLLPNLILGKTNTANYWVGGDQEVPPVSEEPILHDVRARRCTVDGVKTYFVVTIRLFAFLRTPIYHVVTGEVDGPAQKVTVTQ